MRGNFLVISGVALIIAGAVLLYNGYSTDNPAYSAIAWAALIGGTLALLGGLANKVSAFMEQKPNDNTDYAHAEIRILIRSMGEMAAADGVIDPREVDTIADIHKRMLGITITTKEVNEILTEFDRTDNIAQILAADRKLVNPAMKRKIIQSCYLVMIADGDKAKTEMSRLYEIADALGIPKSEVKHLISLAAS
ncbi:MAG: TerB family tellurite resistance protein [Rhizobiaceae bacterium]|nr:TerB family tellurite resistance protein [Rhizobiaceae bacterium]